MLPDLKNEVAVITGGANGIGLALALACGEAGMKVAITDISAERLETAAGSLAKRGIRHIAVQHDVTSSTAWTAVADRVEAELGPALLLFNNAGVVATPGPALELPMAAWEWMIATNLTASLRGVQTFVPGMIARRRGGHIVNTGSIQSLVASPGFSGYNAAKFGLLGLSETLRIELAPHKIGVSVVCPGATRTGLFANSRSIAPEFTAMSSKPGAVLRHYLTPAEVAAKVMDAIAAGRFYIVTHPEYHSLVGARLQEIAASFEESAPLEDLANIEEVERDAFRSYSSQ